MARTALGYGRGMSTVPSAPARLAPVAAGWAAVVTGVAIAGGIGSDTSSDWYRDLDKPSWQPPRCRVRAGVDGPVRANHDRRNARGTRRARSTAPARDRPVLGEPSAQP